MFGVISLRSEEHTSELQSRSVISYAVFCLKVEAVQGKQGSLEWTETSGVYGNGGTTLEFLSPFLWRAPPLVMRRERCEFFPHHAGKGSLHSS